MPEGCDQKIEASGAFKLIHARWRENATDSAIFKRDSPARKKNLVAGTRARQNNGIKNIAMLMRARATLTLLLGLLLAGSPGRAQNAPPSESQVKAAFLFNFAKFVEWPASSFADAKAPLCIGVLGESPFGPDLEQFVRDKSINNRSITVKECHTLDEAKNCHLLFISVSEKKRLPEIFAGLAGTNVLTVSETEEFIQDGGMINLFREGNKFRFEINDPAAKKAGLKIDSKLLELSRKPAR